MSKKCSQFSYSVSSLSQFYDMVDSFCNILPHGIYMYMKFVSNFYLKTPFFSICNTKNHCSLFEMTSSGGSEWTSDLFISYNAKIVCQLCPWQSFHTKQGGFLHCPIVFVGISAASPVHPTICLRKDWNIPGNQAWLRVYVFATSRRGLVVSHPERAYTV